MGVLEPYEYQMVDNTWLIDSELTACVKSTTYLCGTHSSAKAIHLVKREKHDTSLPFLLKNSQFLRDAPHKICPTVLVTAILSSFKRQQYRTGLTEEFKNITVSASSHSFDQSFLEMTFSERETSTGKQHTMIAKQNTKVFIALLFKRSMFVSLRSKFSIACC